jgi:hypothetical protein
MSDWPDRAMVSTPLITPWSEESFGTVMRGSSSGVPATGVLTAAVAHLFPFRLAVPRYAERGFWVNGATTINGNVDIGIYSMEGNRLASTGATAQATASVLQSAPLTAPLWLLPDDYWMAFATSSATGTFYRISTTDEISLALGMYQATATSGVLPSSLTPAVSTLATPLLPLFGIAFTTLV